ncbi:MAG: 50S ribosomal protein L13 [Chloroflexi bacterium]|nr:50S ribosomal protein L13 [Chloroflexota bacterium]|tara:strand:- start:594 stop:1010 length:417 start_codon:yes stop_codon:yes gene_type:complete
MENENTENWIEINAKGRTLGRLATEISVYLLGKNKPTYSPDKLSSNFVIITNASEIHVTGSKLDNKEIYTHSGFIGGLKRETLGNAIKSNPSKVLRKSVKGMLPKNKLSEKLIHRLKIYAGAKHPHSSQLSNRSSNDN